MAERDLQVLEKVSGKTPIVDAFWERLALKKKECSERRSKLVPRCFNYGDSKLSNKQKSLLTEKSLHE